MIPKLGGRTVQRALLLVTLAAAALMLTYCGGRDQPPDEPPVNQTTSPTAPDTPTVSPLSPLSASVGIRSEDVDTGLGLYQEGRYEEAMALFDRAIAQGVDLARAHGGRAAVYVAWRRYEEAVQEYTTALMYGSSPELLVGRCNALRYLLKHQQALDDCRTAIEMDPDNPEVHLVLASLYLEQGDTAEAQLHATKVLEELDPGSSRAAFLMGMIALQQGNAEEAMAYLTQAIELDPEEPQYYWERGFLALGLGQVEQARADMEAILRVGNPRQHGELMLRASSQLNFLGGATPESD